MSVLFVEDSESDVKLTVRELGRAGLTLAWERVDDAQALREALARRRWDVVISDSSIPQLDAYQVLAVTRGLAPHTPLIVLSGMLETTAAADLLRAGAADFITKRDLTRLAPVIARELARPVLDDRSRGVAKLLVAAQESEARRIAGELHARVGQLLAALVRALELAHDDDDHDARTARLDEARGLADQAIRATRELSTELWPSILDDLGLAPALRWLGERYAARIGHPVQVDADPAAQPPAEGAAACYRIAEEALGNIARHAGARRAWLRLDREGDAIVLTVTDDGRGFDLAVAWQGVARGDSLGLLAMRERALLVGGSFAIDAAPGAGTTVRVQIPAQP